MMTYQKILLGYIGFFIMGYAYGVIDTLSGFNEIQVILSAVGILVPILAILFFKPRDVDVLEGEEDV